MDWISAFKDEVQEEIDRENAKIEHLKTPVKGHKAGLRLTYALIAASVIIIFLRPNYLLIWLIVAILLYSYNFVFLLIPTSTTEKTKIKQRLDLKQYYIQLKAIAKHLMKKKALALEMGITIFLGGMVPLALSFTVIFGIGLFFALDFGIFTHQIDSSIAITTITQVILILLFYVLIIFFEPHAQGLTRMAKKIRSKYRKARSTGRKLAVLFVAVIVAVLILITTILFVGALLLPGSTLVQLVLDPEVPEGWDLLGFIFVMVAEAVIMRHFQGINSRRMALNVLRDRERVLKKDIMDPLMVCVSAEDLDFSARDAQLEEIRTRYCTLVIYDITEHSFYGYAPVYLVAPNLRYAVDDKVIACAAGQVL